MNVNLKALCVTLVLCLVMACADYTCTDAGLNIVVGLNDQSPIDGESASCSSLMAGQHDVAGRFCLDITNAGSTALFQTDNGWRMSEVHLWCGSSTATYPKTKTGAPKIGNFPYGYTAPTSTFFTERTFNLPLSLFGLPALCDDDSCSQAPSYYCMAHAVVRITNADGSTREETAWANGVQVGPSWATKYTFNLPVTCSVISPTGPPTEGDPCACEGSCETAFAYSSTAVCFITGYPTVANGRWGWTNGPLTLSVGQTHTMLMYGGAGQCDLSKGEVMGTITIERISSTTLTVTYQAYDTNIWKQVHLYVGTAPLPTKSGQYTVSPGQFPLSYDEPDYCFTQTEFTVNIPTATSFYVVAHASACGGCPSREA